jgi:hypothetical protein
MIWRPPEHTQVFKTAQAIAAQNMGRLREQCKAAGIDSASLEAGDPEYRDGTYRHVIHTLEARDCADLLYLLPSLVCSCGSDFTFQYSSEVKALVQKVRLEVQSREPDSIWGDFAGGRYLTRFWNWFKACIHG